MIRFWKNALIPLTRVLLTAGCLWYILSLVEPARLSRIWNSADHSALLLALILVLPNIGFQYAKWRLLVRAVQPAVTEGELVQSLFTGFTFAMSTPIRAGEFVARAWSIQDVNKAVIVGLTAVDKFASGMATLLIGIVGTATFLYHTGFLVGTWIVVASILSCVLALALIYLAGRASGLQGRRVNLKQGRFARFLRDMISALGVVGRRRAAVLLLLSMLFYTTFVVQFYLLLSVFHLTALIPVLTGITVIMLAKTIIPSITIGELGIREGVSMFVLAHIGVPAEVSFNASMLLFVMNMLLPALAGSLFILRLPLHRRAHL